MLGHLNIACSSSAADDFSVVANSFNQRAHELRDRDVPTVSLHSYSEGDLVQTIAGHDFSLFVPSTWFSLIAIEDRLRVHKNWGDGFSFRTMPFATSPICLVMERSIFDHLSESSTSLGWHSLADPNLSLRLAHAHGSTSDGLAAMTAQSLWATSRAASEEAAQELVADIQQRVVEHGPDDRSVMTRALELGVDIAIVQEQAALWALQNPEVESVVVYPGEGTVWVDRVVVGISSTDSTPDFRHELAARASPISRSQVAAAGQAALHAVSADLGSVEESDQLLATRSRSANRGVQVVNYGEKPMILPGYDGVRVIAKSWGKLAKGADVFLVLDRSASMDSTSWLRRCKPFEPFASEQSNETRVGLILFNTSAQIVVPLLSLSEARPTIDQILRDVEGYGETALRDAAIAAAKEFERTSTDDRHASSFSSPTEKRIGQSLDWMRLSQGVAIQSCSVLAMEMTQIGQSCEHWPAAEEKCWSDRRPRSTRYLTPSQPAFEYRKASTKTARSNLSARRSRGMGAGGCGQLARHRSLGAFEPD